MDKLFAFIKKNPLKTTFGTIATIVATAGTLYVTEVKTLTVDTYTSVKSQIKEVIAPAPAATVTQPEQVVAPVVAPTEEAAK